MEPSVPPFANPPKIKKIRRKVQKTKGKNVYGEKDFPVYYLGLFYERRFQECISPHKRFFKNGLTKDHKSWEYFKISLKCAEECRLSGEDFVEAQIWWWNNKHHCFPTPWQVSPYRPASKTSIEIANEWKEVFSQSSYYVKPKSEKHVTSQVDLIGYYGTILKNTAKKFNLSEKEVLNLFGTEIFPQEFINFKSSRV